MSSEGGPSATADATLWIPIPSQASFTVRTVATGRELRFEGPGRVRPCGNDVALVAEGSAVGLPGSGEAPGAEQWVATACGVARWASGVHRLLGARDVCTLQSSLGTAQVWVPDDVIAEDVAVDGGATLAAKVGAPYGGTGHAAPLATDPERDAGVAAFSGWRRVDGRRTVRLQGRSSFDTPAAVKSALGACELAAVAVESLAKRMTDPASAGGTRDATNSVGELAAHSVVARGVARAACAVAEVRIAMGRALRVDAGASPTKPANMPQIADDADQLRLEAAISRWHAPR